jgi:hypothetical protein
MELSGRAQAAFAHQRYGGGARIDGVELVSLRRFHDDGGAITELARLTPGRPDGLDG